MINGIGCDIVDHKIIDEFKWETDKKIQSRVFSKNELEYYKKNNSKLFLAGRFAAKESVLKCLGTGMYDGISLKDIEILQDKNGRPKIHLHNEVKTISDQLNISFWHVSISHSQSYSIAFVTAEG